MGDLLDFPENSSQAKQEYHFGAIQVSFKMLAMVMALPENARIVAVYPDPMTTSIIVVVESPELPALEEGMLPTPLHSEPYTWHSRLDPDGTTWYRTTLRSDL